MKKLLVVFCFIFCVMSFEINAYAGTDEAILNSIENIMDLVQKEKKRCCFRTEFFIKTIIVQRKRSGR
ncbi:MAG: hypothetical protein IK138_02400 [Lachnospiraceae bacterium]|nr:hypothetical protein [Lachnospiraceae bacterium]